MKTIYLTFDDGPSSTTEELLRLLEKHKVKATFFVTCEFSKDKALIERIHKSGHQIGLHSYTHDFARVYQSCASYLEDLGKIDAFVYDAIEEHKKLIRYPGGSGNASSIQYGGYIMPQISKSISEQGYIEHDWNVSAGDGNKDKPHSVLYHVLRAIRSINVKRRVVYLSHNRPFDKNSIRALDFIIPYCKLIGFRFETLDENVPPVHIPFREEKEEG